MLKASDALVIMIDMQEKLVNATNAENEVKQAEKIIKTAEILNIPVLVSEQYPKGLGQTLAELKNDKQKYIEKTSFSLLKQDDALDMIRLFHKKQIVLFGIETHICVYQTAMDLIKKGYEVYLIKDACKSRKEYDYNAGIDLMRQNGIKISCVEIALFELLESSKNPHFKEVQQLIK